MGKNIVIIGMPGCGKTTIGKILSKRLKYNFVDLDEFIEKESGKTIPELFTKGEDFFRDLEREAVVKLSSKENLVIATGGGVIKNHLNIRDLKKKGVIVFIDRPAENIAQDLEVSGRPLLKDGVHKLYELFNERYELYRRYCDFSIVNDNGIEKVIELIIERLTLEGLLTID